MLGFASRSSPTSHMMYLNTAEWVWSSVRSYSSILKDTAQGSSPFEQLKREAGKETRQTDLSRLDGSRKSNCVRSKQSRNKDRGTHFTRRSNAVGSHNSLGHIGWAPQMILGTGWSS